MRWISQVLGLRAQPSELPCLVRINVQGKVRLNVLECPRDCGRPDYRIDLERHVEEVDDWVEIASLQEDNLEAAITLLGHAKQCIENLRSE